MSSIVGSSTKSGEDRKSAALDADELFKFSLEAYQITDFKKQILNYPETHREHVSKRLMGQDEFELSMRDGFFFGHPEAGLGEFLSFAKLPRLLKKHYPEAQVFVGLNRFSHAVFENNPFVDGIGLLENRRAFGSQKEFGFGTTTQRRLLPMGIFASQPLGPEMFLNPAKVEVAKEWVAKQKLNGRKLVFIQSSGRTNPRVFSFLKWSRWLRALRDEFMFVQIGNLRDQFIWAEKVLLKQWDIQEMASLLSLGDAFVGPNSGVMHLASAVGTRAVVMHNEALASEMSFPVLGDNEVLPGPVNHHLFHCYPWHYHLVIDRLWNTDPSVFAERASLENFRTVLRQACLQPNPKWTAIENRFVQDEICLLK